MAQATMAAEVPRFQLDSYQREIEATVLSCEVVSAPTAAAASKKKKPAISPVASTFLVVLDDTVLFAEGGGQPSDVGFIGDVPVKHVARYDGVIKHLVEREIAVGEKVRVRLDWDTRWEHMQQHSAQHLISAIAENHFGWETTSWEFGLERCNIELHPTRSEQPVTPEALMQLQHMSNELIRTNKPVTVKIVERPSAEPPTTSDDARAPTTTTTTTTTTVPKGHHGPLRIVSIQDVDDNQCCGTHVSSLSQLQAVAFIGTENARGNTRLFFVAGDRVLRGFTAMYQRERQLKDLLSTGADDLVPQVTKMQRDIRGYIKSTKALLDEIAASEAQNLIERTKQGARVVAYHRDDADNAFMSSIANKVRENSAPEVVVLVSSGDPKSSDGGAFVLWGPEAYINKVGKQVATLLGGSGGGKGGRFQGKIKNLAHLEQAIEYLNSQLE